MYKIILTENRVKTKELFNYIRERDVIYRVNKIRENDVFISKNNVYKGKKLTNIKYEVLIIKERVEGEDLTKVRSKLGLNHDININDPDWVVLGKLDYHIEELYTVSGANRKLSGMEILNHIILNNLTENNIKQVLMLNNKVVIEGLSINVVTCKDKKEASRLYNKLRLHVYDNNISGVIFFGSITKSNKSEWYKRIHKITGIGYNRLYRSSSR